MSTELETKMSDHSINQFWGGSERGVCVQVTASGEGRIIRETVAEQIQEEGFITLTMEEASALCNDLGKFIKSEAVRRQGLLKRHLHDLELAEKTAFHEVAELPADLMDVRMFTVSMISQFCPKSIPITEEVSDE